MLLSHGQMGSTSETTALALHKGSIVLQSVERILQASNLSFATGLLVFVTLRLGNASILDSAVVLHHGAQLVGSSGLVATKIANLLVEALELLGLVLDILGHLDLGQLVFLRVLIIRAGRIGFLSLLLGQVLREVTFTHFKDADDAATSSTGLLVLCRLVLPQECSSTVVVAEHAKCLLHTVQGLCQIVLCHRVISVLLSTDRVHISLLLRKRGKTGLQILDLGLALGRGGGSLINLGGQRIDSGFQVCLLCFGLGHLLIAEGFLCGIILCFLLELGNHVCDQTLDLGKNV